MTKRTVVATALLAAVAAVPVAVLYGRADDKPAAVPNDRPFGDNDVHFTGKTRAEVTMSGVELRTVGGRVYFVGRPSTEEWIMKPQKGASAVWVPADEVAQAVVRESPKGNK